MLEGNKEIGKQIQRSLLLALVLPLVIFSLASCGKSAAKPAGHKEKADAASLTLRGHVLADAKDDIAIIENVQDDWQTLTPAVAGKALDTLKSQIEELKAEGLVKVRDYEDVKLKFGVYQNKVAGVTAEFLDNSSIVKMDNGEPMAVARAEKRKLYLGLAKVDGKWKIITILAGVKEAE